MSEAAASRREERAHGFGLMSFATTVALETLRLSSTTYALSFTVDY